MVFDQFPRPSIRSAGGGARKSRNGYVAGRTAAVIYDPFELDCVAMDSEETSGWEARRLRGGGEERVQSEDEDEYSFTPPVSSRYLHSGRYRSAWRPDDEAADAAAEATWLASAVSPSPSPEPPRTAPAAAEEDEEMETDDPPTAEEKQQRPTPPADSKGGTGGGGGGSSNSTTHEESPATPPPSIPMRMKSRILKDVIPAAIAKNGGANGAAAAAAAARNRQQDREEERAEDEEHDETMDEEEDEGLEVGRACSNEDSPTTSSSEADHTESSSHSHLLPLGEVVAGAVHHHRHNHHQHQLHLAAGNASVLSPPDSTAPSPRVSNGSSGSSAPSSASPMVAAPAHSNGGHAHNGHDEAGSGNGLASGYEAAAPHAAHAASDDADAWRVRAKLVTMEAVASRLTMRVKDPDASSRESGCSPTEKSLPSLEDGVDGVGVVVQLVEPWREASNSPSESNSSSDYTPPASTRTSGDVDARLTAYATLSSEEESGARTGDHPALPAKPTRKPNGVAGVQQLAGLQRSFALAAAATTPSPVV